MSENTVIKKERDVYDDAFETNPITDSDIQEDQIWIIDENGRFHEILPVEEEDY